jgi:hypothetical protein
MFSAREGQECDGMSDPNWRESGFYGSADDELMQAYLNCSAGGSAPELMWTTGRVLRSFGIEVSDDQLDTMFEVTDGKIVPMEDTP